MSRNLYKEIKKLEEKVTELEVKLRLQENKTDHLETLLRLRDVSGTKPFSPTPPTSPWYYEPTLNPPYKITCELEKDPFVKLMKDTFKI